MVIHTEGVGHLRHNQVLLQRIQTPMGTVTNIKMKVQVDPYTE